MGSYFVFFFIFLFSYFLLLLYAAAEFEYRIECGKNNVSSEYDGEISFPFSTVDNKKCGFYIRENNSLERNLTYKIDRIKYRNNSIFIHGPSYFEFDSESIKNTRAFSLNNISFYRCKHGYKKMSKYSNCYDYDYDIYFNSTQGHAHMFPHFYPTCLSHFDSPYEDCAYLNFSLEIQVDLDFCEGCYNAGSLCLPNQETLNFSCVHVPVPTPHFEESYDIHTERKERHLKAAVIGLSIVLATVIAIALFVMILFLYYWRIKSSGVKNQLRTNYHGLTRNETIPENGAVYFGIPVFSYEELKEATNNFDQARELGEGGFGTIYYGKLGDGREVAVKRLFERNYRPVESFTNEIQILTRMRHRNLVSLYGCTSRHSRELLLVYEYIPNGTVSSHLHDNKANQSSSLPWSVRMKIAIETASALTYLHASDVIHRDVKTTNILLDNNFCVKVADFGLSRLYPNDVTHVSTAPRGTPGYVDPEYRLCYQLTNKSDVYSFGVVLVELISSLPAVDLTRDRDDIKLANLAIRKIRRSEFCDLIDPSLGFQTDKRLKNVITSVAELAFRCLQEEKELRPTMSEVLEVLQTIESRKDEAGNHEGIDFHPEVEVAQSYVHPSVPNTWMTPRRHRQTL